MTEFDIAIFGEVLFDCFEDGSRVLGGAPFNVAWHLQGFGVKPLLVSKVGNDPYGQQLSVTMKDWGMSSQSLGVDQKMPTGVVTVNLHNGQPSYCIEDHQAYDFIEENYEAKFVILYHGSLALRHQPNRQALTRLKQQSEGLVFLDVNLRSPWWTLDFIEDCLRGADWVKLNIDEFAELQADTAGLENLSQRMLHFQRKYDLQGLIVTLGEQGAWACRGNEIEFVAPEATVNVVDTVGAGDAFAAVFLLGLIASWPLSLTLKRAQQFASITVGVRGATLADRSIYQSLMSDWSGAM